MLLLFYIPKFKVFDLSKVRVAFFSGWKSSTSYNGSDVPKHAPQSTLTSHDTCGCIDMCSFGFPRERHRRPVPQPCPADAIPCDSAREKGEWKLAHGRAPAPGLRLWLRIGTHHRPRLGSHSAARLPAPRSPSPLPTDVKRPAPRRPFTRSLIPPPGQPRLSPGSAGRVLARCSVTVPAKCERCKSQTWTMVFSVHRVDGLLDRFLSSYVNSEF